MWYMVIHSTIYVRLCNSPAEVEERLEKEKRCGTLLFIAQLSTLCNSHPEVKEGLEKGEEIWYMVIHSTIYILYATHRLK